VFTGIGCHNMQMFAYAAKEHCAQHGTKVEHFAKIASKNRIHGSQNPRAAIQVW
jgi:acetyl-CoA acetyltransferase